MAVMFRYSIVRTKRGGANWLRLELILRPFGLVETLLRCDSHRLVFAALTVHEDSSSSLFLRKLGLGNGRDYSPFPCASFSDTKQATSP